MDPIVVAVGISVTLVYLFLVIRALRAAWSACDSSDLPARHSGPVGVRYPAWLARQSEMACPTCGAMLAFAEHASHTGRPSMCADCQNEVGHLPSRLQREPDEQKKVREPAAADHRALRPLAVSSSKVGGESLLDDSEYEPWNWWPLSN